MMKQDSREHDKADKKQSEDTGSSKSAADKKNKQKEDEQTWGSKIKDTLRQMY